MDGQTARFDRARSLLGAAVVATTLGMTAATFRGDGTAINAFLFLTGELSHVAAARVERTAMILVLLLSIAALFRPHWALLLPVGGYALAEALARWHELGYAFSEWAISAQAPRYLTPLALALLVVGFRREGDTSSMFRIAATWILRIALAVVFAVHGLEALKAHPGFIDYIISSSTNMLGARISEGNAIRALEIIGVLDLAVAAAILLRPLPGVLWWAAFWGLVTALARVTANGIGGYPDVLVRGTHVLVPLALWLLMRPVRAGEIGTSEEAERFAASARKI